MYYYNVLSVKHRYYYNNSLKSTFIVMCYYSFPRPIKRGNFLSVFTIVRRPQLYFFSPTEHHNMLYIISSLKKYKCNAYNMLTCTHTHTRTRANVCVCVLLYYVHIYFKKSSRFIVIFDWTEFFVIHSRKMFSCKISYIYLSQFDGTSKPWSLYFILIILIN